MVKQQQNYIAVKKKQYLTRSIFWGIIITLIMLVGISITGNRGSLFTVVAALLVLPLAQNITRYVAFFSYRSPSKATSDQLEQLQGDYSVYHGAILPMSKATFYYEHIVVTSKQIYFLTASKEMIDKSKRSIETSLEGKGISSKQVRFCTIEATHIADELVAKIEKAATFSNKNMTSTEQVIEGMMM